MKVLHLSNKVVIDMEGDIIVSKRDNEVVKSVNGAVEVRNGKWLCGKVGKKSYDELNKEFNK